MKRDAIKYVNLDADATAAAGRSTITFILRLFFKCLFARQRRMIQQCECTTEFVVSSNWSFRVPSLLHNLQIHQRKKYNMYLLFALANDERLKIYCFITPILVPAMRIQSCLRCFILNMSR